MTGASLSSIFLDMETTTNERNEMKTFTTHLDELSNDELCTIKTTPDSLTIELKRVENLINNLHLTGVDLNHWFSRSRILQQRIEG